MAACSYCFSTDGHHVNCPYFQAALDIGVYGAASYADGDREAAAVLRLPLIAQLAIRAAEDRRAWMVSLARGVADGLEPGVEASAEAYRLGQRIALLLVEEGHA